MPVDMVTSPINLILNLFRMAKENPILLFIFILVMLFFPLNILDFIMFVLINVIIALVNVLLWILIIPINAIISVIELIADFIVGSIYFPINLILDTLGLNTLSVPGINIPGIPFIKFDYIPVDIFAEGDYIFKFFIEGLGLSFPLW